MNIFFLEVLKFRSQLFADIFFFFYKFYFSIYTYQPNQVWVAGLRENKHILVNSIIGYSHCVKKTRIPVYISVNIYTAMWHVWYNTWLSHDRGRKCHEIYHPPKIPQGRCSMVYLSASSSIVMLSHTHGPSISNSCAGQ